MRALRGRQANGVQGTLLLCLLTGEMLATVSCTGRVGDLSDSALTAPDGGDAADAGEPFRIIASTSMGAVPLTVEFEARSASGAPPSVPAHWSFGDDTQSDEARPRHTYFEPGTYRVTLQLAGSDAGDAVSVTAGAATLGGPVVSPTPKLMVNSADAGISLTGAFRIVVERSLFQSDLSGARVRTALVAHAGVTAEVVSADDSFAQYQDAQSHPAKTIFMMRHDDPRIAFLRETHGEKMADYSSLVGANGFGQGYLLFMRGAQVYVLASTAEGLFYGAITLSLLLEQAATLLPQMVVIDYPDLERRIFYPLGHEDRANLGDPTLGLALLETMARAKINGVYTATGSLLNHWPNMFLPYIRAARARFIRPIIGWSTGLDVSCAIDGYRVDDEPFVIDGGIAVPTRPEDLGLNNLDFADGPAGGVPSGWSASGTSPTNGEWKLAPGTGIDGGATVMLARGSGHLDSRPMISQIVSVPPRTWALAEFTVRTENTTGTGGYQLLLATQLGGIIRSYRQEVTDSSHDSEWQTIPVHLSPWGDADRLMVWIRPDPRVRGTVYVDNIKVTRMNRALVNVLLGNGHTFRVIDANTGAEYQEGVDYRLTTVGTPPTSRAHIQKMSSWTTVERVSTGSMAPNAALKISYDYLFEQDKLTASNLSPFADCGYASLRDNYQALAQRFADAGISTAEVDVALGQDEIRGFNQDARARAANVSNAEALSIRLNRLAGAMRVSFPDSRAYFWSDMLDRSNGLTDDYQMWWGGKAGITMPAMLTLPPNVELIPWWYNTSDDAKVIREAPSTFRRHGIRVAGGAGGNVPNLQYWSAILHGTPSDFVGHSTFEATLTKEEAAKATGAWSWRNYTGNIAALTDGGFELCNGVDDDGNGQTDEDYDLTSDADHCGSCSKNCDMPHGWGQCVAGSCVVGGCVPGFRNVDGRFDNGCELAE